MAFHRHNGHQGSQGHGKRNKNGLGHNGQRDQDGQAVVRRVDPFSRPEYEDRFSQIMAPITQQTVFSGMPPAAREEAQRRALAVSLGIRVAYELEQEDYWVNQAGVPRKPGEWGQMDPSIQTAQDRGKFERGSFMQQAVDQVRFNANEARHAPFNQPRSIQGQSLLAMLGPCDPGGRGGAAESHVPPSSRFERLQY